MGLAKVTIVKKFGKITSLWTCSGVTTYYVKSTVMYILCAVQDETESILYCIQHMDLTQYVATPLHVHKDVILQNFLTIVTLARPKYEHPDDGHRPKHVGACYYEF